MSNLPTSGTTPASGYPHLVSSDGRAVDILLQDDNGRPLTAVFKPGDQISGRVVERFANDLYLFALRGRQLLAESRVPLLRDSVVRFTVLDTEQGLALRANEARPGDRLEASPPHARLSQLGIGDSAAARTTLAAFEAAGAPLTTARVQTAINDVLAHSTGSGPTTTPSGDNNGDQRAAAHATLARLNLPTTNLLLDLAGRSLGAALPQPGRLLINGLTASAMPPAPVPATGPQQNPASTHTAAAPAPAPAPATTTPAPVPTMPAAATPAAGPSTSMPAPSAPSSPPPLATAASTLVLPLPTAPDPGHGGRQEAARALHLAGLQSAPPSASPAGSQAQQATAPAAPNAPLAPDGNESSLIRQLVSIAREFIEHGDSARQGHLTAALREVVAETLVPPARLDDYDLVLPLALADHGQAVPARIAVSSRAVPGSGANASLVRIDLELSRLGPLSVRFSAHPAAPIGILILATGPARTALADDHAALCADLEHLGIDATIRIDDLLAVEGRPHD
ncbi:MAG: hypothetical protein ACYTF0_08380 [Planctomycetota bacterium]|jgi:hypothetical protein